MLILAVLPNHAKRVDSAPDALSTDTPPKNTADRVQFLMDHYNDDVTLKARSKGNSVPQLWQFQVFGLSLSPYYGVLRLLTYGCI